MHKSCSVCLFAAAYLAISSTAALAEEPVRPTRLTADFTMKRTLKVLTDTLSSSGKLTLGGPGLLRWETFKPAKSLLVINRDKAWIHYPDMGFTKDFSLSDDPVMSVLCDHLLALTVQDFGAVGRLYDVVDEGGGVKKLSPKDGRIRDVFKHLKVKIDEKGVVSWVEITSVSGDVTRIEFENVRLNPDLEPASFEKPVS